MNELALMRLAWLRSVGAMWERCGSELTPEQSVSHIRVNMGCTENEAVAELYFEVLNWWTVREGWAAK